MCNAMDRSLCIKRCNTLLFSPSLSFYLSFFFSLCIYRNDFLCVIGSGEIMKTSSFRNKEQLQFTSEETPNSEAAKAVSEEV